MIFVKIMDKFSEKSRTDFGIEAITRQRRFAACG